MNSVCLLGSGPITKAFGNILSLFGMYISHGSSFDILIMVDGDSYKLEDLRGKLRGTERIIYLKTMDVKSGIDVHSLCFMAEIFQTVKIPLEHFSIVKVGELIKEIEAQGSNASNRLAHGITLEDIFNGKVFEKLPRLVCLKPQADKTASAYLHDFEKGTWTLKNLKDVRTFISNPCDNIYKTFERSFNSENLWRRGQERLLETERELKRIGFGIADYLALEALKDRFNILNKMNFPGAYPVNKMERSNILVLAIKCYAVLQEIDSIRTGNYNESN